MRTHVRTHRTLNDFENGEGRSGTILVFQAKLYQVKFQAGFGYVAPMTTTGNRALRLPWRLASEGTRAAARHSSGGSQRPHTTSEAAQEALSGSCLQRPWSQMSPQAEEDRPCDSGPPLDHASASVSPALRWGERPTQGGVTPSRLGATFQAHVTNQGEIC